MSYQPLVVNHETITEETAPCRSTAENTSRAHEVSSELSPKSKSNNNDKNSSSIVRKNTKQQQQHYTEPRQLNGRVKAILNDIESFSQSLLTQLSASAHPIRKEIELRYCFPMTPSSFPISTRQTDPSQVPSRRRDSQEESLNSAPETGDMASESPGSSSTGPKLVVETPGQKTTKTPSTLLLGTGDDSVPGGNLSINSVDPLNATKTPTQLIDEAQANFEPQDQQQQQQLEGQKVQEELQQQQEQPAVVRPTAEHLLTAGDDSINGGGESINSVDPLNATKTPTQLIDETQANFEPQEQHQPAKKVTPMSSPSGMSFTVKNHATLPKILSVADYTLSIEPPFPKHQENDDATTSSGPIAAPDTETATATPAQSALVSHYQQLISHYQAMGHQHIEIYTLLHRLYQECLQHDCLRGVTMNASDSSPSSVLASQHPPSPNPKCPADEVTSRVTSGITTPVKSDITTPLGGPAGGGSPFILQGGGPPIVGPPGGGGPMILQRPPPVVGIGAPQPPLQQSSSSFHFQRQSKAFANGGHIRVQANSGSAVVASASGTPTASFRLGANSMRRLVSFGAGSNGVRHSRRDSTDSIQSSSILSLAEFNQVVESQYHPGEDAAGFETINNYAIIEELGRGNFGKVMLACDEEGNQVAIKSMSCGVKAPKHRFGGLSGGGINTSGDSLQSLRKAPAGSMQSLRRGAPSIRKEVMAPQVETMVMREVAIMKKLRHKNIVQLKEVIHDEEDDMCHLVMDYISGGPLAEVSKDGSCISTIKGDIKLAKEYICQAAAGLEYLHRQGIVHRDVKPENLLVGSDRDCYVADFGVSAVMRDDKVVDISAGTQTFFSPELVKGDYENASKYGKQSDVWALGATFYALVYEKVPFYAPNLMALATAILHDPVTFPDDVAPDDEVRVIISGLLHKDPGKRWTLRRLRHTLDGRRPVRQRQDANDMESSDRPAHQGDADLEIDADCATDSQNSGSDASPWDTRSRSQHSRAPRLVERVRQEVSEGATPKEELPSSDPVDDTPLGTEPAGGRSTNSDPSAPPADTSTAEPDATKPKPLIPTPPEGGVGRTGPPRVRRGSKAAESYAETSEDDSHDDDIDVPTEEEIATAISNSRVSFYRPVLVSSLRSGDVVSQAGTLLSSVNSEDGDPRGSPRLISPDEGFGERTNTEILAPL